jgi:hypothetical protein
MRDPKDREVELSFWESVRESDNPATEDADRLRDVLHALLAEILEAVGELAPDMVVDAARDADAAGLGQPLETHGNIDAVAEDVAVLHHDIADIDADAKPHASFFAEGQVGLRRSRWNTTSDRAVNIERTLIRSDRQK